MAKTAIHTFKMQPELNEALRQLAFERRTTKSKLICDILASDHDVAIRIKKSKKK